MTDDTRRTAAERLREQCERITTEWRSAVTAIEGAPGVPDMLDVGRAIAMGKLMADALGCRLTNDYANPWGLAAAIVRGMTVCQRPSDMRAIHENTANHLESFADSYDRLVAALNATSREMAEIDEVLGTPIDGTDEDAQRFRLNAITTAGPRVLDQRGGR